jgi:HlyD family secretion protein
MMDIPLPPSRLVDEPTSAMPEAVRKRRVLIIAAGVVVVVIAAAAYLLSTSATAPSYRFATVTAGPVTASIIASGTVNPVTSVQVGSQVSGQIKELEADFNSRVSNGQLVARIDPSLFETQAAQASADLAVARANVDVQQTLVDQAGANLASARATLQSLQAQTRKAEVGTEDAGRIADRARKLAATGSGTIADRDTTQAIYDQAVAQANTAHAQEAVQEAAIHAAEASVATARANLAMAQAQTGLKQAALETAQVNLDHTYIRAPVDGTVVLRNVDVGQTVVASLQAPLIFTIAQDLSHMQVDASVDEADVGAVKVGQLVTFTVDAYPGRVFEGSVQQVRIAPQVVQNVVTYDVVVSAPNTDLALLPGLTANTRVVTDHRDTAVLVPNAALRYWPSGFGGTAPGANTSEVWTVGSDGHPLAVSLRLGISDGNVTEVLEGKLPPGATVIVGDSPSGAPAARQTSPGMTAGPRF